MYFYCCFCALDNDYLVPYSVTQQLPELGVPVIQMFEIFSNFFIVYGKKRKREKKVTLSEAVLTRFRVFKFHFAKCEGARTQFSN